MSTFHNELESLINKFSMENDSNTPDFILAQYLHDCLGAFGNAMIHRDKWYGLEQPDLPKGGAVTTPTKGDAHE